MALARSQIPMFFDSYNIDTHDIWGPNSGSIVSERERVTEARERERERETRETTNETCFYHTCLCVSESIKIVPVASSNTIQLGKLSG